MLISFILCATLVYAIVKLIQLTQAREQVEPEPQDQLNFIRAEQELEAINKKRTALRALEYLITDVDACNGDEGLYKFFTLSWLNETTGENMEYQFYIWDNKSAVANAMKALGNVEREKLRLDFQDSLNKVGERCRNPHQRNNFL